MSSLRQISSTTSLPRLTQRDYVDPPPIPNSLSQQALAEYRQQFASWWEKTKRNIVDLESDVLKLKQQITS